MDGKDPMQAGGADGDEGAPDGVNVTAGEGESEGGHYPNPHDGRPKPEGGFTGHGGQSDIAYHGEGQLGDERVPGEHNDNSATRSD